MLPDKINNKWDLNEFYATGVAEITKLLNILNNNGIKVNLENALDYGCGAGRLTEALARKFVSATGVDFSQNMINLAKTHGQFKNLNYEKVNGQDISNFPAKTFDFIVSLITLQHSPAQVQYLLLKEMIRILKNNGVIVVSMYTHMSLGHLLRNTMNNINPKFTNYILTVREKFKGRKLGHYDIGVASQMFPVSRKKVLAIFKNFGMNYKYIETAELTSNLNSKIELFIGFF